MGVRSGGEKRAGDEKNVNVSGLKEKVKRCWYKSTEYYEDDWSFKVRR